MDIDDSDTQRRNALDSITSRIIGAALAVHSEFGPGMLETTYEDCMCLEFLYLGIPFASQVPLPIVYRGTTIRKAYKPDFVVEDAVILELKAVEKILPVHEAQVLTYMKLSGLHAGLLINFNAVPLTAGIRRFNK